MNENLPVREPLPQFKVKLGEKTYVLNWEKDIEISEQTSNEDLIKQASNLGYYGVLEALAKDKEKNRKLELSVLRAELAQEYRDDSVKKGEKVVETRINSELERDQRFIKSQIEVNEASKYVGIFRAIVRAFEDNGEDVRALASNLRKQSEPNVVLGKKTALGNG